ncbi:MAG: permease-like cell division protein FtsX, partial [Solobacterium sp.]|nr:permease-like cell division protein FtsX [Solobacterium sp.]
MKINSFFYSIQQGVKNIWRNKLFSLASIATMAACIFLFGLFYMIVTNFQDMVQNAEEGVAITVFFQPEIGESEIIAFEDEITRRPEVAECVYVSADQAWEEFKSEYFEGHE